MYSNKPTMARKWAKETYFDDLSEEKKRKAKKVKRRVRELSKKAKK